MTAIKFTADVVVIGAFNPMIIRPDWLIAHGVAGTETPSKEPQVKLGLSEMSPFLHFSLGGLRWQVTDRHVILRSDGQVLRGANKILAKLLTLLPHTPLVAVGVNLHAIVPEREWHAPRPKLSESLSVAVAERGRITEELHGFQVVRPDGALLNVSIRDSGDELGVEINYHKNTPSIETAMEAIDRLDDSLETAKQMVMQLCGCQEEINAGQK